MDLKELKREMPFKWRVQSCSEYGAKCVAYIDARAVQDILDEVCEPQNWQVVYEEHKGNLFAKIGIKDLNLSDEWIWKSDCGTESNVEKIKGEASDAFKRAAVMWGVGRFLYSKKLVSIKEVKKNEKTHKYEPMHNGKKIWDITKHCNGLSPAVIKTPAAIEVVLKKITNEQLERMLVGTLYSIEKNMVVFKYTEEQQGILDLKLKALR